MSPILLGLLVLPGTILVLTTWLTHPRRSGA